jgi:hypothetical protein
MVDTTVWIDFFSGKDVPHVKRLLRHINANDICITGIILTEILQGIKNDDEFKLVEGLLRKIPVYEAQGPHTYIHAAQIYRQCKKSGFTIRKTIDCIIAAIVMDNNLTLLHNDKDFDKIAEVVGLNVIKPQTN